MANKFRGEALLLVEGSPDVKLIFDTNALCEIEDATGFDLNTIMDMMQEGSKLRSLLFVRALLYGCAKRHLPNLTVMDAGDLVTNAGIEAAVAAITEAMQAAFPDAKEGATGGAKPPKVKRGSGTGPKR